MTAGIGRQLVAGVLVVGALRARSSLLDASA